MNVFLIVDMQVGLFEGQSRHDAEGVIQRINNVASAVRGTGGMVIFIQHEDLGSGSLEPGPDGWGFLPALSVLRKTPWYASRRATHSMRQNWRAFSMSMT